MTRALIVDDDFTKLARIADVLESAGFEQQRITTRSDAVSAKEVLARERFDLVVLDIALPWRTGEEIRPHAGLDLVDEILRPGRHSPPDHIVGITAHEELFKTATDRLAQRLLTILYYDPVRAGWEEPLRSRAHHILASRQAATTAVERQFSSLAVLVTALDSPELAAVLRLPFDWKQSHIVGDHAIYYFGRSPGPGFRVIAASTGRKGMVASALLAAKMISRFRPKILAMVGISAGVPSKTALGDIIVAEVCWDWGSGKILSAPEARFAPAPYQLPASRMLVSTARHLALDHALLGRLRAEWPGPLPSSTLRVHVGPVASGASVIADEETRMAIMSQHRELLGIEMEAYGVYAAADQVGEPRPEVVSIKSVVDFADATKSDDAQAYAAYTSTAFLRCLLEQVVSNRRDELARQIDSLK